MIARLIIIVLDHFVHHAVTLAMKAGIIVASRRPQSSPVIKPV